MKTMNMSGVRDTVRDMTIAQLRNELTLLKLKAINVKAELVRRLQAEDRQDEGTVDQHDECDGNCELNDQSKSEGEDRRGISPRENCLRLMDVKHLIDTFNGENGANVIWWIEDFEGIARLCGWNEIQKTIYAKKLLRGSARLFVKYEMRGKLWKDIKFALKQEFFHNVNFYNVQKELQARKKRSDETYNEYCYKMFEIASRVKMDINGIIQYIIDGIVDEEVNKSILYGAGSIPDLKKRLLIYEMMKSKSKD